MLEWKRDKMKWIFLTDDSAVIVEAKNKHMAIDIYVKNDGREMSDFYYGLEGGQVSIIEITKEIA